MSWLRRSLVAGCAVSLSSIALGACGSAAVAPPVQYTLRPSGPVSSAELASMQSVERARLASLGVAAGSTVRIAGGDLVVAAYLGRRAAPDEAILSMTGQVILRHVECFAPPYRVHPGATPTTSQRVPGRCRSAFRLDPTNLQVQPNANSVNGYTANTVQPDPNFLLVPSTSPFREPLADRVVLAGLPADGTDRYVLGPAVLTGAAVMSAAAQRDSTGAWVVDATMTTAGASALDRISQMAFHQFIAIELDGVVLSAPLVLPAQTTWTSFNGQVSISGSLSATEASRAAIALADGALAVPVTVVPFRTLPA
jgi:hypothetical protein